MTNATNTSPHLSHRQRAVRGGGCFGVAFSNLARIRFNRRSFAPSFNRNRSSGLMLSALLVVPTVSFTARSPRCVALAARMLARSAPSPQGQAGSLTPRAAEPPRAKRRATHRFFPPAPRPHSECRFFSSFTGGSIMQLKSRLSKKAKALAVAAALAAGAAHAALPAGVQTALDDAKSDGLVIAGAVLIVIIAIAAFKLARRAI